MWPLARRAPRHAQPVQHRPLPCQPVPRGGAASPGVAAVVIASPCARPQQHKARAVPPAPRVTPSAWRHVLQGTHAATRIVSPHAWVWRAAATRRRPPAGPPARAAGGPRKQSPVARCLPPGNAPAGPHRETRAPGPAAPQLIRQSCRQHRHQCHRPALPCRHPCCHRRPRHHPPPMRGGPHARPASALLRRCHPRAHLESPAAQPLPPSRRRRPRLPLRRPRRACACRPHAPPRQSSPRRARAAQMRAPRAPEARCLLQLPH
mmetsp:Transcript_2732/g.10935  ORF Transcript_2732/g.10935 Transcript_2732/m.10935 type:complete len:263 (-) Transcript_2732:1361-2149(-)